MISLYFKCSRRTSVLLVSKYFISSCIKTHKSVVGEISKLHLKFCCSFVSVFIDCDASQILINRHLCCGGDACQIDQTIYLVDIQLLRNSPYVYLRQTSYFHPRASLLKYKHPLPQACDNFINLFSKTM